MLRSGLLFVLLFGAGVNLVGEPALNIVWPTPNPAYATGESAEHYVQPTISGEVTSAFFGCVRNSGTRFHEGVDLKPTVRDRRGEALDPVFAVMGGVVLHANRVAGNSSYGRYIVLEHAQVTPPVITLYAHMASIDDQVRAGNSVRVGQTIGIMGRSAGGYTIPRERAHVHFEIGFWMSRDFQSWYNWRRFGSKNQHGLLNGMNIIGFDAVDFYDNFQAGRVSGFQAYIEQLPVAYTVRVRAEMIPDFVGRYPSLMSGSMPVDGPGGWEIDFTSFGLPKAWRALSREDSSLAEGPRSRVIAHDPGVAALHACRNTLRTVRGVVTIGSHTERVLQLMFGFR